MCSLSFLDFRSGAGTSTEPPINDNDVVLQEAIGKKGSDNIES